METSKKQTKKITATEFVKNIIQNSIRDKFDYVKYLIALIDCSQGDRENTICKLNFFHQFMFEKICLEKNVYDDEKEALRLFNNDLNNIQESIMNFSQIEKFKSEIEKFEKDDKEIFISVPYYWNE